MTVLFTDDFNRADEALTASPNWDVSSGGTSPNIVSNAVVDGGTSYAGAIVAGVAFPADQYAEMDVVRDKAPSLYVRKSAASGTRYGMYASGTSVTLDKIGAGGYASLQSVAGVGATAFRMRLEVTGSTLRGFIDGVEVVSAVDTELTDGAPGFGFGLASTSTIDNFEAGDMTPPPSLTITQTELTPGGTISGTYADYATIPTTLTVSDGTNTITIASPTITDNGDGTGSFSGAMPTLPTTGTANLVLFGEVTVELA